MNQIPVVVHVLQRLAPQTVLDVGKGFGKYGFLIHEYVGIPTDRRPHPQLTLCEQSTVAIDAVEVQADYLFPHLEHLYRKVIEADISDIYSSLSGYDVVLLADVIEHLDRGIAESIVRHFIEDGSAIVITTPKQFFRQHLYQSDFEEHVSHWTPRDFDFAPYVDWQPVGPGVVYLVCGNRTPIRGFGHGPVTRARRIARLLLDELDLWRRGN